MNEDIRQFNQGKKYESIIESVFLTVYGRWPAREGEQQDDDDEEIVAMLDYFVMESNLDVVAMAEAWKKRIRS